MSWAVTDVGSVGRALRSAKLHQYQSTEPAGSAGAWTGSFSDGTNTYSGPLDVSMTYSGYANPSGTFLTPCTGPNTAVPVSSATIMSPDGISLSCQFTGTFERANGSQTYDVSLTGSCSVEGGAPSSTQIAWTGTLGTCTPSVGPLSTCPAFDDSYTTPPPA